MALKLFLDFDGTVAQNDVGNEFFVHFGGEACERLVHEYHLGNISASECFRREAEAIGLLPLAEFQEFLDRQELTPGFAEFVTFCRRRNLEFHIVSDGLDTYIRSILERNGLHGLSFFSNTLALMPVADGASARLAIASPHATAECGVCACCKRNILLSRCGEEDIIGYVGDGFSDRCAVQYADIVFAKGDLQTYCREENVSYYVYKTFHDVIARLEKILAGTRLRKRRRAEMKRREAFICEA